ncbi:MAG TPA: outer membrane beta-barrel protein [Pirellulaceae bacterium]|nr:outer membrane beta-barrel protein [Pirellulaceae bacterium]
MNRLLLAIVFLIPVSSTVLAQSDVDTSFQFHNGYRSPIDTNASQNATLCEEDECPHDSETPYFLMRSLAGTRLGNFLINRQINVYGWTEGAFTASTASTTQLPLGFNYRANDFLLQQNWLRVERAINPDAPHPTFGFRSDTILPGSDYRFTVARGLADGQTGSHGFDPVQFYGQAYLPQFGQGLDVKAGRFFGQYGVESIAGIDTPFVSRAYNFIYNPFTHTGLLTTLKLNDCWTVQNGIVTGSDVFFDSAAEPTYIGSLKWDSPDQQSSLSLAAIVGSGRFNIVDDFSNPQVFDLVYNRQLRENLSYTLNALYGFQTNVPGIGTANWYAFVNYLTYQWSEQVSSTTRLEFFDDVKGDRTGFEGLYTAITTGLSYQPGRNLLFRPEIRYDYNDSSRPFDNRSGLFTAAFDFIVRW